MINKKEKTKAFLVREIPTSTWEQFKIKCIQNGTTCNKTMLKLVERYASK